MGKLFRKFTLPLLFCGLVVFGCGPSKKDLIKLDQKMTANSSSSSNTDDLSIPGDVDAKGAPNLLDSGLTTDWAGFLVETSSVPAIFSRDGKARHIDLELQESRLTCYTFLGERMNVAVSSFVESSKRKILSPEAMSYIQGLTETGMRKHSLAYLTGARVLQKVATDKYFSVACGVSEADYESSASRSIQALAQKVAVTQSDIQKTEEVHRDIMSKLNKFNRNGGRFNELTEEDLQ